MVQQTCIERQEYNPVTTSRHVESDNDGSSSPHEPILRDLPHGENLNIEPMMQSADVKDGETSINQEEATCTSPNSQQGRSNSYQMAAVNATAQDNCRALWNRLVLHKKTASKPPGEHKFFDPGGERD